MTRLIALAPLFILICSAVRKPTAWNEDFSLSIESIEEFNGFGTGSGFVTPKKGHKFIGIFAHFTNTTGETRELDMDNMYLLDTASKTKYKLGYVLGTGGITVIQKQIKKVKAGKTLYRKLVFSIPDAMKPSFLEFQGRVINL